MTIRKLFVLMPWFVVACSSGGADDGTIKQAGEPCSFDGECASGQCETEGGGDGDFAPEGDDFGESAPSEQPLAGVCAAGVSGGGSGGAPSGGGCTTSKGASVADGDFYCDKGVLYQCLSGSGDQLKNCNSCKYVGAGTGHEYDTSCRTVESATQPSDKPFEGPGCYFGYDRICS